MLNMFESFVPAETIGLAVLGGAAWAGVHFLFITPEYAERTAKITHMPACLQIVDDIQAGHEAVHNEERQKIEAERNAILNRAQNAARAAREEAQRGRDIVDAIIPHQLRREAEHALGLPGIFRNDNILVPLPEIPTADDLNLPPLPAPVAAADPASEAAFCGCTINRLQDEARWELTGFTASFGIYRPYAVTEFQTLISDAVAAETCGPVSGGVSMEHSDYTHTPFKAGRFVVTSSSFRAPARTFALRHIIRTQLRRPLLIIGVALLFAVGLFLRSFWELIYLHEVAVLVSVPLVMSLIGMRISVLTLEVRGARERGIVIGPTRHLRAVRQVIDDKIDQKNDADGVMFGGEMSPD